MAAVAMTLANRILENKLLARLPAQELAAIRPDLVLIDMTLHRVLIEAGEIAQHLYFPQSGLASIVVPLASGVDVEV
jgi:CRP-like cAMP-binding protein